MITVPTQYFPENLPLNENFTDVDIDSNELIHIFETAESSLLEELKENAKNEADSLAYALQNDLQY